jgi:hypothetical protein
MFAHDSSCSPIVFSHNDLQCGNILIHEQRPGLKFVDFEYRLPTLPQMRTLIKHVPYSARSLQQDVCLPILRPPTLPNLHGYPEEHALRPKRSQTPPRFRTVVARAAGLGPCFALRYLQPCAGTLDSRLAGTTLRTTSMNGLRTTPRRLRTFSTTRLAQARRSVAASASSTSHRPEWARRALPSRGC